MGQYFSRLRAPPARTPSYRANNHDLATAVAGRRGPPDTYVIVKYTTRIGELQLRAKELKAVYEKVRMAYASGSPYKNEVTSMIYALDEMRRVYEEFFRESSWQIDDKVDERKKMARGPYFQIERLRTHLNFIGDEPKFGVIENLIRTQIKTAHDVNEHYQKCQMKAKKKELANQSIDDTDL